MTVKIEFTIPQEAIRDAVRAELDAALPALLANLLAGTAVQTGTVPAPAPVEPPAEPPAPETPPAPEAPVDAPPAAPAPAIRATRDASALSGALAALALPRGPDDKPVEVPALPVRIGLRSAVAVPQSPHMHGHAFAPGDVPAGHRLRLRRVDGTGVPVQVDGASRWPDGSLRYGVLSYYTPALAAGVETDLTLDAVPGEQDRTPFAGPDAMGKLGLVLRAHGWTWGEDAAVLRVADAVDAANVDKPAADPAYRIETKAAGPHRVEYRIEGIARRERDGAVHDGVTLRLYATLWRTGELETLAEQAQEQPFGPVPGATWKTTGWNERNVGAVELLRNGDRLWALGGPNDRDARTVPPHHWDAANNRYLVPMGQNLGQASGIGTPDRGGWNANGVAFGVAGSLPGGLDARTPYYLAGFNLYESSASAKRWAAISTRRFGDAASMVDLTSAPAGECTTFPLVQSFPGAATTLADAGGDPFYTAAAPRPPIRTRLDMEYMGLGARLIAPIDGTVPLAPQPAGTDGAEWPTHPHRPGQLYASIFIDHGLQGDDWHHDRIGPWSRQFINWLFTPYCEVRRAHCLALAHSLGEQQWRFADSRTGRAINVSTREYPGLGAPIPNYYGTFRSDLGARSSTPGFVALANWHKGGSGLQQRYDPLCDGSHLPSMDEWCHLMTGRSVHMDRMRTTGAALLFSHDAGIRQRRFVDPATGTTKEYSLIFWDQYRAVGWARLAFSNLVYMLPDAHPEKAYFADAARENAELFGAVAPHSPWREFGQVPLPPASGKMAEYTTAGCRWNSGINNGFQGYFEAAGTAMCLFRGEAGYRPVVDVYLRHLRDAAMAPHGHPAFSGIYFAEFAWVAGKDAKGNEIWDQYKETAAWARDQWRKQNGTEPFPADRNFAGNHHAWGDPKADQSPSAHISSYEAPHLAVLALADWLGFPGCADARMGIIAQVMPRPDGAKLPRDRFLFGSADHPEELGLRWAWVPRGI